MAGGNGTRLWPLTSATNKHLLPIYNKPMIYYSLTLLMFTGATEIAVVSSPEHINDFSKILGTGSQWGLNFEYVVQNTPKGIAQCFEILPKSFQNQSVSLVLGDNLLYGAGLGLSLKSIFKGIGATAFAYAVADPQNYGVVELNKYGQPLNITEKPDFPKSNLAIPGIYFFDNTVWEKSKKLKMSERSEFEITDLLHEYLKEQNLRIKLLERGTAWLDTGTTTHLMHASEFVRVIEKRQGLPIGSPEEVSLRLGLVDRDQFEKNLNSMPNCEYKNYLRNTLL